MVLTTASGLEDPDQPAAWAGALALESRTSAQLLEKPRINDRIH